MSGDNNATFESVSGILNWDQAKESKRGVVFCVAVYYAVQSGFNFEVCGRNL